MIDGARCAGAKPARDLVLTGQRASGLRFRRDSRRATSSTRSTRSGDGPGISGADDRRRGAGADVTADDRGAGRPLPRHDGGGEGRRATRLPPIAAISKRAAETVGSLEGRHRASWPARRNGRIWRHRPWRGGRPRFAASSASCSTKAFAATIRRRAAAAAPAAAAARGSSTATRSSDVRRRRGPGGAASRWRCATSPCSNCSTARACARPSWSPCRAGRCGPASRS